MRDGRAVFLESLVHLESVDDSEAPSPKDTEMVKVCPGRQGQAHRQYIDQNKGIGQGLLGEIYTKAKLLVRILS